MKQLSAIAEKIKASTTLAIDSLAKQMRAEGQDVIGFGAGEPDFITPENIRNAGIAAINSGKTKYTPAAGIPELRRAVCARLKQDFGLSYDISQAIIASGAKHIVYVALCTLLNPGDEVILPAPYWISYYEMICMAGGIPVIINADEAHDFKITSKQLDEAITPRTKCMILNNPSNPTGMLYSKSELEAIAEVCKSADIYVIADEIYSSLVYDGKQFFSFAALSEDAYARTILVNGVSKSYAMTGWRIGYAATSAKIAKIMGSFLSHSTGAPATMSQLAAVEALDGQQKSVSDMRLVFEERRNYIVEKMNAIEGVSCKKPDGAFYVMMNIEKLLGRSLGGRLINGDEDFAIAFLEKALVAVVPCVGFGAPGFVRWTYAASMESIKEGLARLEKFLNE